MATLSTAARNASVNAVVDLLDNGGAGSIEFGTTGFGVLLATLPLSNPAFGDSSIGVAVANSVTSDTDTEAGTAAEYRIKDGSGTIVLSGTVGDSPGFDFVFDSLVLSDNGTCSVVLLTYTQPAS